MKWVQWRLLGDSVRTTQHFWQHQETLKSLQCPFWMLHFVIHVLNLDVLQTVWNLKQSLKLFWLLVCTCIVYPIPGCPPNCMKSSTSNMLHSRTLSLLPLSRRSDKEVSPLMAPAKESLLVSVFVSNALLNFCLNLCQENRNLKSQVSLWLFQAHIHKGKNEAFITEWIGQNIVMARGQADMTWETQGRCIKQASNHFLIFQKNCTVNQLCYFYVKFLWMTEKFLVMRLASQRFWVTRNILSWQRQNKVKSFVRTWVLCESLV